MFEVRRLITDLDGCEGGAGGRVGSVPALATRSVHAIAARWGFVNPGSFNRTFRAAYGSSPGEYRRLYAQ